MTKPPRKLDPQACEALLMKTELPTVGATVVHRDLVPEDLGIGRRVEPRNEFVGAVLTRLADGTLVIGLSYHDAADDADNEDMYVLDLTDLTITSYMRSSFEKEYPEYEGHHRAEKQYLRKPPNG